MALPLLNPEADLEMAQAILRNLRTMLEKTQDRILKTKLQPDEYTAAFARQEGLREAISQTEDIIRKGLNNQ